VNHYFVDVPKDYWARPLLMLSPPVECHWLLVTTFGSACNWAEFAALQDAFDQSSGQSTTEFNDISSISGPLKLLTEPPKPDSKRISWECFPTPARNPRGQNFLASGLNPATKSPPSQTYKSTKMPLRFLTTQLKR